MRVSEKVSGGTSAFTKAFLKYYSMVAFKNFFTSSFIVKSRCLDRAFGALHTLAPACSAPRCLHICAPVLLILFQFLQWTMDISASVRWILLFLLPGVLGAFLVSLCLAYTYSYFRSQHTGHVDLGRGWQFQFPWESH